MSKFLFARGPSRGRRRAITPAHLMLALVSLLLASMAAADTTGRVDLPRFPAISPDGSEIVFSWGGDLWRASSSGGTATRLTSHPLDDLHASWSPDGDALVFTSLRDGYLNLWRIRRDGTGLEQLTHADRFLRNPAWNRDGDAGETITFSSHLEGDVYREQRPYAIAPTGGQHERLFEAFGSTPRISPDGRHVAFTRGGYYHDWGRRHYRGPDAMDVWLHDRDGGSFSPLTEREGDDGDARWLGNNQLVFLSDRDHRTVNLFLLDVDARESSPQRLTDFTERDIQHFDVARDGRLAVFQVRDQLYTLDLEAADATPEALDLRAGEDGRSDHELRRVDRDVTEAALSPDGKVMAMIAYGRVYVRHVDEHSATHAVTRGSHARHSDLAWSPDGLRLYFTSDADGTESIHEAQVALTREEIRRAWDEDRRPPEAAATDTTPADTAAVTGPDGSTPPADEDADQLTSSEPTDPFGPIEPLPPLDPTEPPLQPDPAQPEPPDEPATDPAAEPDTIDEEDLTEEEDAPEMPPELDPARWHDAVRFHVRPVVATEHNDRAASPSPDGGALAFRRGRGDLVIRDLATGEDRRLVEGWDSNLHWRWSPDSRHIAYTQNDLDFSANIFIVPTDGSADPVNITRHPRNDLYPRWSADGRKLSFISNRSGESYDLYRVYLDRALANQNPRERARYYRNAREAAGKRIPLPPQVPENPWSPTLPAPAHEAAELDLTEAWRRVDRITAAPGHQTGNEMTPGGDRYLFNAQGEGLVVMNWDGSERRRLGSAVNLQHLTLTGDRAVYVDNGRAGMVKLSDAAHQRIDLSDRVRIDRRAQSLQKFHEAARMIEESFYRPDLKGLDWPALVADYAELIGRARTSTEFSDIANRFMGELAASHMGVSSTGPATGIRERSGRLGIDSEQVERQNGHYGYRVKQVLPEGPADKPPMRLQSGDVITRIDGEPFTADDTLLRRLSGRVGEEVIVTFERRVDDRRRTFQALITPVDFDELARLRYDDFRRQARHKVEELSDGRLGYIHIQSMNQASLEQFQGELYAAAHGRDGLIIDVRNNGGGHTTDRILTSIMTAEHAYTIPAGADPEKRGHYPQDRLDAPRYTQPMNMLANEKSHSNAEILAHAFRTLERGTLVGEQTYGGVISTGTHRLIDGSVVRRPFRGWFLPDGTDMEHHGARPHLHVEQTPDDEVAGRDRQLERAVEDLLERIDDRE